MTTNGMKAAGHEYIVVGDCWVGITMREVLGRAGHPVVFSLCKWGMAKPQRRLGRVLPEPRQGAPGRLLSTGECSLCTRKWPNGT